MATAGSPLDNGSYSTIQPPTFTTYNIKIGVWPAFLEFFDTLSQKSIQNSHQTCIKKLNDPHVIRSCSPVTNPSGVLNNTNLTWAIIMIVLKLYLYFMITISFV